MCAASFLKKNSSNRSLYNIFKGGGDLIKPLIVMMMA